MLVKRKGNVYIRCNKLVELFYIYKLDLLKCGCFVVGTIAVLVMILILGEIL